MRQVKPCLFAVAAIAANLFFSSCTLWDSTSQQQAKEAAIALAVSTNVRADPAPPAREKAWQDAAAVLDEFIKSGNADSAKLRSELYTAISKILSPALSAMLVDQIMAMITEAAGDVKNQEKLIRAEITVRDGIILGIGLAEQPAE